MNATTTKGDTMNKDTEVKVNIWKKPETENMAALFTISVGNVAICFDLPIESAMEYLREYMEAL